MAESPPQSPPPPQSPQSPSDNLQSQPQKRTYTCKKCNFVFTKRSHMLRHEAVHNDSRPFVCTVCQKGYRTQYHLTRHAATHTGDKTYKCSYEGCKVACITEWNLKRHVKRTHCNAFKCKICQKEFKKNKALQQHLSTEHKNSTVCCDFQGCAQIFPNGAKMRHHMKVHLQRGYLCPVKDCSEKFSLWSECRLHTAQCKMKEVSCDVCGKVFKERSNMKAHRKIHSEEREVFACTYEGCGRFYTKQYNLKAHVQSFHMNIRPYVCPKKHCNKSFHFQHLLRNHLDSIHGKKEGEKVEEEGGRRSLRQKEHKKRPQRMQTSTLSGITGYIPELWTRMTPEEIKRYVDGDKNFSGDEESSNDSTQHEMDPLCLPGQQQLDLVQGLDENSNSSSGSEDISQLVGAAQQQQQQQHLLGVAQQHEEDTSEEEEQYETITELLQINPYIYKPVQRVVRKPRHHHHTTASSHTVTSANDPRLQQRRNNSESSSARKMSESSCAMEQDECMIINSVDLPSAMKDEQEECMAAFNDRFKLMQSALSTPQTSTPPPRISLSSPRVMLSSPRVMLSSPRVMLTPIDVNVHHRSCHLQSRSESESSDSDQQAQQVQCFA